MNKMNQKEFIDDLVKDLSKRLDIHYEKDLEYLRLCINMAYTRGRVSANQENDAFYKGYIKRLLNK